MTKHKQQIDRHQNHYYYGREYRRKDYDPYEGDYYQYRSVYDHHDYEYEQAYIRHARNAQHSSEYFYESFENQVHDLNKENYSIKYYPY